MDQPRQGPLITEVLDLGNYDDLENHFFSKQLDEILKPLMLGVSNINLIFHGFKKIKKFLNVYMR